jgi:hypothetical protein
MQCFNSAKSRAGAPAQRHNGSPAALPDSAGWQPASRDKLEAYPPSNSPPMNFPHIIRKLYV